MNWYINAWKNYAVFNGRATRPEFWYFVLIHAVVILILGIIDYLIGRQYIFASLYYVAAILPYLAVAVRRLHDINRSGWWLLLMMPIPIVGWIVLLIFLVSRGTSGKNRFGGDPQKEKPN